MVKERAGESPGPLWRAMDRRPRHPSSTLTKAMVPTEPGVYAWYRRGRCVYVGKAKCLQDRVWGDHHGQGRSMGNSAFRRNVAEHLGIATANDIKEGRYRLSEEELKRVNRWTHGCDVAWLVSDTEEAAIDLEDRIKAEWKPRLTKR
jgi:hypothetical protein